MSFNAERYQASAPGSLMVLGEYAVLYNKPAVVCAVNQRMRVQIKPREDEAIELFSPRLGHFKTSLSTLSMTPPFHFVTACLYGYRKKLKSGCDIHIDADFSDQIGLGSSAGVTVATLAALDAWLGQPLDRLQLLREARRIVLEVQTVGSGADVAASVMGGILAYRVSPLDVVKFSQSPALTVIYSGSKTKTVDAIQRVKEKFASSAALFNTLCQSIHHCADEGIDALNKADWPRLGATMNVQQGLMQALGVSTPLLDELIERLRSDPAILGAKISGSGWGDCIVGVGQAAHLGLEERYPGVQQLAVQISQEGVRLE